VDNEFLEGIQEALNRTKPGYKAVPSRSRHRSYADSTLGVTPDLDVIRAQESLTDSTAPEGEDFEFFTGKSRSTITTPSPDRESSGDRESAARIVPIAPDSPAADKQTPFPEGVVYDPKKKKITGWKS